jgi:hypothetical protein
MHPYVGRSSCLAMHGVYACSRRYREAMTSHAVFRSMMALPSGPSGVL